MIATFSDSSRVDARIAASLRPMRLGDLDAVTEIEGRAYTFAWTRGNFVDSLEAGYIAEVLCDQQDRVLGYFVALNGVEELHLLNISVAPEHQGRGYGLQLLDGVLLAALLHGARVLWLEVRPSNAPALRLYERYGLHAVARRRDYYPAQDAQGRAIREDAIVMSAAVDQLVQRRGLS